MYKKVVLYARLSVSDIDRTDGNNSLSISNQINYIEEFCIRNGVCIDDYYIDDGCSGIDFERKDFKRLIKDIERNIIKLVIVKDISRLGRNFVELCYYVNQYFPSKSVYLISIDDNYDSRNISNNYDESIFNVKSFINERYIKDISRKIKQVKVQKTKDKNYLGIVAPYGYIRINKNGRNTLEVDKNVSSVVKRIFYNVSLGKSLDDVALALNKDNISSPAVYMGMNIGNNLWTKAIIYRIIRNVIYCGNMYYRKSEKHNYKQRKRDFIFLCDRKIINNTHPAIVSVHLFDLANKQIRRNGRRIGSRRTSLFLDKIYCGRCGKRYSFSRKKRENGRVQYFFYCNNRKNCFNSLVDEKKLKVEIFDIFKSVVLDKVDINYILEVIVSDVCSFEKVDKKIRHIEQCIDANKNVLDGLYLNFTSGKLGVLEFVKKKEVISRQNEEGLSTLEMLQNDNYKFDYLEKLRKEFYKFVGSDDFFDNYFSFFVDKIVIHNKYLIQLNFLFNNKQQMETETT